jgi:hypothetical protein
MESGSLSQFFLAQSGLDALLANRVAKDLQWRSLSRHSLLAKQEGMAANTPNMGLFFFLRAANKINSVSKIDICA